MAVKYVTHLLDLRLSVQFFNIATESEGFQKCGRFISLNKSSIRENFGKYAIVSDRRLKNRFEHFSLN